MADPTKKGWVRTAQEVRDQRSGVDERAEKAKQGIVFPTPEMEIESRRRTGPMKKFTAEDVLAINPGASPEHVARVLEGLNREPVTPDRIYEIDDESLVQNILRSLDYRGPDGLTEAERKSNAFAEAFGAPPPFPPKAES
jgi:hypothetical protein